jgi:hypothetical protein
MRFRERKLLLSLQSEKRRSSDQFAVICLNGLLTDYKKIPNS